MATTTACWRVLNTPELLEQILLNVSSYSSEVADTLELGDCPWMIPTFIAKDFITLLLCQRTNTTFRDVITSSPTLQQHLFFLPPPSTTSRPDINPMVITYLSPYIQIGSLQFQPSLRQGTLHLYIRNGTLEQFARIIAARKLAGSYLPMYLGSRGCEVTEICVYQDVASCYAGIEGEVYRMVGQYEINMTDSRLGELLNQAVKKREQHINSLHGWSNAAED